MDLLSIARGNASLAQDVWYLALSLLLLLIIASASAGFTLAFYRNWCLSRVNSSGLQAASIFVRQIKSRAVSGETSSHWLIELRAKHTQPGRQRLSSSTSEEYVECQREQEQTLKPTDVNIMCSCHNPIVDTILKSAQGIGIRSTSPLDERDSTDSQSNDKCTIFVGGNIYPCINKCYTRVEAIAILGKSVLCTGTYRSVRRKAEEVSTQIEEMVLGKEQALLPGFVDPHVHIVTSAMLCEFEDFGPFVGQRLRKDYSPLFVRKMLIGLLPSCRGTKRWVVGKLLDPSLMPFSRHSGKGGLNQLAAFDTDYFDRITTEVPVLILSASLHTAYVNTPVLRVIYHRFHALRSQFPNLEAYRAHVNAQGGLQEMQAIIQAVECIPAFQLAAMVEKLYVNLDKFFKTACSLGLTTLYDAGMNTVQKMVLRSFLDLHEGVPRIGYAKLISSKKEAEALPMAKPVTRERFERGLYQGHVKLVSDGSNQGLTGFQEEPYCCDPAGNYGHFNFGTGCSTPAVYKSLFETVLRKGHSMMVHANGNRALKYTLAAFEMSSANGELDSSKRNRVEHCSLLCSADLDKMQSLGISPSFLIGHVGYWGYAFRHAIFEEKANQLDLCRSALDKGLVISLHSDSGVTPLGPLRKIEQSVTRIMEGSAESEVLNEYEKLCFSEALEAVTSGAAWQIYADRWIGSLAPGKFADFVIIEQDPFVRATYTGLRDVDVNQTWINGRKVFPLDTQ